METEIVAPMLATPGPVPGGPGWAYEFKWDGVRAVAYAEGGTVRVLSRNHRDVSASYPEMAELGRHRAVLDGEIVALDAAGRPSFAELQRRMHVAAPSPSLLAAVPVRYHVFDVLRLDGESTLALPYHRRRELLDGLDLTGAVVDVPAHFPEADPAEVTAQAARRGLEGVVAKRLVSPYRPGRRSPDWVKTPFSHSQEVVIVGWRPGEGRRSGTIGSLVLAVTGPDGVLAFAGGVGTGFTGAMLAELRQRTARWERRTPPLAGVPREYARGAHWVEPVLVGEVAYRNWTPDGRLRHPSWRGLRPDRTPDEARRPAPDVLPGVPAAEVKGAMVTPDGRWRVEVVSRGGVESFRIAHGDNVLEGLDLAGVEELLAGRGVDLRSLRQADPAA